MNAEIMGEWLRRQGLRVITAGGGYWVQVAPRIYQAFPYHCLICPDDNQLKLIFRSLEAVAIRYSAPLDSPEGMISYHVIYSDKDYSLDKLPKKARYDVRKGMSNFDVKLISCGKLASEGWELRYETLVRQKRTRAESKSWWERLCSTAEGLPGIECWGATDVRTGKLASSLLSIVCDNCFSILYQQSRTEHMRLGANSVLSYFVTREALKRFEIKEVFYGLHSLDAAASVDEYKFRLGFRARPVRQRVVFHHRLPHCFPRLGLYATRKLLRLKPESPSIAKAEGMFRFAVEGSRTLCEQKLPEPLR
jgi:hypothetical protein